MKRLRKRVFEILDVPAPGDWVSKAFDMFILALIVLNVLSIILETTAWGKARFDVYYYPFEVFSVIVFTIEYLLRVWSCVEAPEFSGARGRVKFALQPLLLVDLFAILPFYLPFLFPFDLRILRVLRLIRIFRVLKLARYVEDIGIIFDVLDDKKEELFFTVFLGFLLWIITSSLMYFIEHEAQPEVFRSIPDAMWWGVATLVTIDPEKTRPITIAGKILWAATALIGIGMFALPAGILGSGFIEELRKRRAPCQICPHCGKEIGGEDE